MFGLWERYIVPPLTSYAYSSNAIWKRLAGGCHLTRDAGEILDEGGFRLETYGAMYLPNTPKIAGYSVWGSARAA